MHNLENRKRTSATGLRKGAWTEEEDTRLRKCIEKYGEGKWHQVPDRAGLKRCRKSCRLRWLNYLSPNIKRGNFSSDEVDLIIRLHKLLGNRWSLIAGRLPGRTANDVKNYWNTHLHEKLGNGGNIKRVGDGGRREAGGSSSKGKAPKTTASTIIKPRPRTFSKNVPWLREKASNDQETNIRTNDQNNESTGSASNLMFMAADHNMQWLDNSLNDKKMSEGPRGPFSGFGDERIASLWSEEIQSGQKESGDHSQKWEAGFADFCIDGNLWDILFSEQSFLS